MVCFGGEFFHDQNIFMKISDCYVDKNSMECFYSIGSEDTQLSTLKKGALG